MKNILSFEDFIIDESMVNKKSLNQLKKASAGTSDSTGASNLVNKGVETKEHNDKTAKPVKTKKVKK